MVPLYTANSLIQGTGCFAAKNIKNGQVIGEYTGPRISEQEADETYAGAEHTYLFLLDDGTVIDASDDPNPIKYINHSCAPNCEAIEQDNKIFVKAIKDIGEGEELHYDYQLATDDDDEQPCYCGAENCKGTMRQ